MKPRKNAQKFVKNSYLYDKNKQNKKFKYMNTIQRKKHNVQIVAMRGAGLTKRETPAIMIAEQGRSLGRRTPFLHTFFDITAKIAKNR